MVESPRQEIFSRARVVIWLEEAHVSGSVVGGKVGAGERQRISTPAVDYLCSLPYWSRRPGTPMEGVLEVGSLPDIRQPRTRGAEIQCGVSLT